MDGGDKPAGIENKAIVADGGHKPEMKRKK